jgi:CheY-like chemotaxis protein
MPSADITILVVEDEPLVSMSIVAHLQDEGFRVLEAANADQAIAILEQDASVRLIFTDIDMPGSMDGLKLAAAVRDRWPPVHIIVTSGQRPVAADDLPIGSLFFAKPYQHAEITHSMRQLLG